MPLYNGLEHICPVFYCCTSNWIPFKMLLDMTPINGSIEEYRPLTLLLVNKTDKEPLWDEAMRDFHYLGFGKMVGQSIKYLVNFEERPIAALSYNRASLRIEARDLFIGWSDEGRQQLLNNIICNHRFLIFPWVKVKNLASHILAKSLYAVRHDWNELYGIEPKLVETFVDSNCYVGTCYLAANFKFIAETKVSTNLGSIPYSSFQSSRTA